MSDRDRERSTTEAVSHATSSTTTFYDLLSLSPEYHPSPSTPIPPPIPPALLRKSYRQTSLLYHPDKNPSPDAAAHFHTLTTAYDVLSEPATKAAYDAALVAKMVRKRKSEVMGGERRRLKEELEARERAATSGGVGVGGGGGWKKQKTAGGEEDAEFERQLERLREEGARLRMKREEALRRAEMEERQEEEEEAKRGRRNAETEEVGRNGGDTAGKGQGQGQGGTEESRFTELDRTIFIKLHPHPKTTTTETTLLPPLTASFGAITSLLLRHPPPVTSTDKKKKKKAKPPLITAVVVFASIHSAHELVHTFRAKLPPPRAFPAELWERVAEVKWAGGREPELGGVLPPSRVEADTAAEAGEAAAKGPGAVPRFSFRPPGEGGSGSGTGTPKAPGMSTEDYESVTFMRMREMERKMMEAEIRAKEAAEA